MNSNQPISPSPSTPPVKLIEFATPTRPRPMQSRGSPTSVVADEADPRSHDLSLRKVERRSRQRSHSPGHHHSFCAPSVNGDIMVSGVCDATRVVKVQSRRHNYERSDDKLRRVNGREGAPQQSPETPRFKNRMPPRTKSEGSATVKRNLSASTSRSSPVRRSSSRSAPVIRTSSLVTGEKMAMPENSTTFPKPPSYRRRDKQPSRSASLSKISFLEGDCGQGSTRTFDLPRVIPPQTSASTAVEVPPESKTWNCICGYSPEGRMEFCGLCGTKKHWTCAGCMFGENACIFAFCGMCGDSRD